MFEKISFILPVFNEEKYIESTVNSINNCSDGNFEYEVIAIDNGSTDNTIRILESLQCKYYIYKDVNVGAVRNYGVTKASGDLIVFLDADCEIDTDWVSCLLKYINRFDKEYILGGGIKLPKGYKKIEKNWLLPDEKGVNTPKRLIGACIIVPKGVFLKVGKFDENITSGEDTDFHVKAKNFGVPISIDSGLSVIHNGNAKTIRQFVSRQKWHSENYVQEFYSSLSDPVFLLLNAFILSIFFAVLFFMIGEIASSAFALLFFLTIPVVFSIKRVKRSQNIKGCNFFYIYCLDFLYLFGRVLGYLKGFTKK